MWCGESSSTSQHGHDKSMNEAATQPRCFCKSSFISKFVHSIIHRTKKTFALTPTWLVWKLIAFEIALLRVQFSLLGSMVLHCSKNDGRWEKWRWKFRHHAELLRSSVPILKHQKPNWVNKHWKNSFHARLWLHLRLDSTTLLRLHCSAPLENIVNRWREFELQKKLFDFVNVCRSLLGVIVNELWKWLLIWLWWWQSTFFPISWYLDLISQFNFIDVSCGIKIDSRAHWAQTRTLSYLGESVGRDDFHFCLMCRDIEQFWENFQDTIKSRACRFKIWKQITRLERMFVLIQSRECKLIVNNFMSSKLWLNEDFSRIFMFTISRSAIWARKWSI